MQPRVTIRALATVVWLAVVGLVGGAVTQRLSHDQYFPASPHRHSRVQRNQIGDWRDHDPTEDQPLDLWIGSRRSISAEEPPVLPRGSAKFTVQDFPAERSLRNNVSSKRDQPFSAWQRWLLNIAGTEFAADKVDYDYEMPQTLSRETVILPALDDLTDDPFVADGTFQDQGPGSVEIYKLDLSRENVLLAATTPTNDLLTRNKSKSPKKTSNLSPKTKTTEVKSTTTPSPAKTHHGQSNVFEEKQRTETSVNTNSFGVGGVPELQVGCEGLEASSSLSSSSSHKAKRSIDTPDREQRQMPASILQDVTPISLDFDYVLTYDDDDEEEEDEEMDELLRLKKLETTTKKNKPSRGDIDASHFNFDHSNGRTDRLPVRGDLGESGSRKAERNASFEKESSAPDTKIKSQETKAKRALSAVLSDEGAGKNRRSPRHAAVVANTEGFAYESERNERKRRAKRSIDWGFGENEGVVSSNELQTMNARRRKHDMRYHRNAPRKRDQYHQVISDIDKIRREHEERLAQKRRDEEERGLRQQQQGGRGEPSKWTEEEEERRRDEMRARRYDEYRRQMNRVLPRAEDDEAQRRQTEEERQRQEDARNRWPQQEMTRRHEEERRRREEEERRRRREEEEARSRSPSRWQEENLRRTNSGTPYDKESRQRPEDDEEMRGRKEEARRQEWYRNQQEARRRKDEEERRRQEDDRRREEEQRARELAERRRQEEEERRRQQQQQQPPSNLIDTKSQSRRPNDSERRDPDEERRAWEQEERRREQKLREYIARNRPINVNHPNRRSEAERRRYRPEDNRDSRMNTNRNPEEYRRRIEEQRRRQEEEEQRRRQEEEQRKGQEDGQRGKQEDEQRRRQEDEQRRRQEDEQRRRQENEQRRRQEDEQRRRQEDEQRRRQEDEQRRRQEDEQRKRQEDEQRRGQEDEQRRGQENEQRRRQEEEEKKLQDYIKRTQPIKSMPSWNNQSAVTTSRDLFEERRLIEQARRRDRYYPDPGTVKHRGPSVSTYIDPREEARRRQQETARRQEEERRRARERGGEEKERKRLREEQMRKEAARREQEARWERSRRYEEERKRLEAARSREERRRQEMLRARGSRGESPERTRQETKTATRPTSYQDPRLLMEHRRRQDSRPIPSNSAQNNEEERRIERERQRLETERRTWQQGHRTREYGRKEQERNRQELARLSSLPVSARIIVRPVNNFTSPRVVSRNGLGENEIDFTGINPYREGVKVAKFPVAPTPRPPVPSPRPCVWAVVHCCSSNNSRLSKCFESLGCPGINWDPNPCSNSIVEAARAEVMKFYESQ